MSFVTSHKTTRLLVTSYLVALSLIAIATLAIHVKSTTSLARQDKMGEVINVSGRQRMLSQRLAFMGELLEENARDADARAKFSEALTSFSAAHERLTTGDLAWREDHPRRAELAAIYWDDRLDHDLRRYVVEAELFGNALQMGRAGAFPSPPNGLLRRLDEVTNLHEQASQQIVDENRRFAQVATTGILLLLVFEAIFVMMPTARRLARAEDELTTLATTDPLTGTSNRRSLFGAAQGIIRLSARSRRPFSTIVLDIDHFKRVNDQYGHAVGDDAIRHVVAIAAKATRTSDLIGRIGGEEFVIICPETSREGGIQVAEKVRSAVEAAPIELDGEALALTVSLGVHCVLPHRDDTVEAFVAAADEALYEAKRTGRNKVVATERPHETRSAVAA